MKPTVASVINEHVTLELESIDRLYLNIFVPQLQRRVESRPSFAPTEDTPSRRAH